MKIWFHLDIIKCTKIVHSSLCCFGSLAPVVDRVAKRKCYNWEFIDTHAYLAVAINLFGYAGKPDESPIRQLKKECMTQTVADFVKKIPNPDTLDAKSVLDAAFSGPLYHKYSPSLAKKLAMLAGEYPRQMAAIFKWIANAGADKSTGGIMLTWLYVRDYDAASDGLAAAADLVAKHDLLKYITVV